MSATTAPYRRVQRRELHASRAVPAIVLAILAILALAWLGTECVLAALGQKPLLLSPATMATDIVGLAAVAAGTLIGIGVALVVVGIVVILIGVTSGRLARHTIADDRAVVVVHNEMVASALVRQAATASSTNPDHAVASVGKRRATVRLTAPSGVSIDRGAVESVLSEQLARYELRPGLKARVHINKEGKVGA